MTRRWTSTAQSVARMAVTVPNPEERGRRCVVGRDAIYAFREGGDEEEEWEAWCNRGSEGDSHYTSTPVFLNTSWSEADGADTRFSLWLDSG